MDCSFKLLVIRPFWTSNCHPCGMARLFGLYSSPLVGDLPNVRTCFVRPFYTPFVTFVGRAVHFVDFILYSSALWTSDGHPCRMVRPSCGLLSEHPCRMIVHFVDFYFTSVHLVDFSFDPSILWTLICVRPACGL